MNSIIIVEDKKITREGLTSLVDWKSVNAYVAASFEGANDAIEYMCHHPVDLVVTDIEMDDGTGLDLLQYVYANRPQSKVIIISAYEKFAYAQKALSMGACAYLLKPVNNTELLNAAASALGAIHSQQLNRIQEQLVFWTRAGEEAYHYLTGAAASRLCEALEHLGTNFLAEKATFLYFRSYSGETVSVHRLRAVASEEGQPVLLFEHEKNICCILSGAVHPSIEVLKILSHQWMLEQPVQMGISSPAADLSEWNKCFVQAKHAFFAQFWTEQSDKKEVKETHKAPAIPCQFDIAVLKKALFSDNLELAMEHLESCSENWKKCSANPYEIINNYVHTLVQLYDAGEVEYRDYPQLRQALENCSCGTELLSLLKDNLTQCFTKIWEKRTQTVRPIVKLAFEYSVRHIDQPGLNLKMIAKELNVSYVYLSKAFKQDFQQAYTECITAYRIDLAKKYLEDPQAHVYEICAKVGLEPKNFHHLFKKYTGMTPKMYQSRSFHYEEQKP